MANRAASEGLRWSEQPPESFGSCQHPSLVDDINIINQVRRVRGSVAEDALLSQNAI
jgi:hypothetical protein